MKRTYRSKKETGGALDHRDVLLNMDEKSSAFDAFYIQNLKQTKRELSCVGSTNAYGVASKKERKRKYVKRIVKEVENVQPRESMSTSTYLTPDKSIRVNKILDPFDMLLYSSSTDQVAVADNNNRVLEKYVPKKEGKTYTRKNMRKVKKYNYSSEYSSDFDKENTQSNMTDIRTHKLLIEKELSNSPKKFDESINKIVRNLSLINNFKGKTANSFNTSYKHHRNRLMKNCQSPLQQKSPLCSTPFKDKYRGKSIYNFSPISSIQRQSLQDKESPYLTITEERNESSNSIVFLCDEKVPKLSKKRNISPLIHASGEDYSVEISDSKSLIYDEIDPIPEIDQIPDVFGAGNVENYKEPITNNENSESVSEPSLVQITQADPFLGFSDDRITESVANDKMNLLKYIQAHNSETEKLNENSMEVLVIPSEDVDLYKIDKSNRDISLETSSEKDNNLNTNDNTYKKNLLVKYVYYNKSKNDLSDRDNCIKCHSENENPFESRNSNSDKDKFIPNLDTSNHSNESPSYNSQNSSMISQDSEKESMYDTCNSELSFSEKNINNREPKVAIERLNDSLFFKYYEKMLIDKKDSSCGSNCSDEVESQSDVDDSQSSFEENQSEVNESDIEVDENLNKENNCEINNRSTYNDASTSFFNCSQCNKSIAPKDTQSHSAGNQPNAIIITDSSTTEDIESNDEASTNEEACVSFVTTRRRNGISYDSMFIFDNSYDSSSTDCDKTMLSNKARLNYFEKSHSELDISKKAFGINKIDKSKKKNVEHSSDRLHRNTRNNSRLTKQSEVILDMDSSIKKVTNTSTGETNVGGEDKNAELFTSQIEITEHSRSPVTTRKSSRMFENSIFCNRFSSTDAELKPSIVLQPGKKWERSLSIYRRMTMADYCDDSILEDDGQKKGRKYRQSVISTMEMQDSLHNESINSRRSTFISKPSRSTIRFVKDSNNSRISLNTTEVFDDLKGFLTEECDDTVIELSKLSLADSKFDVTVLDKFDETSERIATARDYVLRRCNQTDPILFDECYPETVLKNCHKIGEGVYGEVFLWRGRDGRARVMKIVPIAGTVKVNGETQKDFHEVISEIVIAMELSALRAPIADIDRYFDEGKDGETLDLHSVENATDVFNEVLAVRCVQGPYPSRLLDLWELYDECKGSENDNPAALPADQQYMVLELANAGQDLESYQFTGAQQAHALFQQIAFGLAVGEESFQFEHRDLHWGNVLIAPTEQKLATFVLRGRSYRVPRGGVSATIIDYSLSRVTLPLAADRAALYNDLGADEQLFDAVGDYQFEVYRLMREKLGNDWKSFEPYTNILWLHYTVDKMITALRYKRTNTKIHKHYIEKLKGIKDRILSYKSATEYVLTDIEI